APGQALGPVAVTGSPTSHPLDNPVWSSMIGAHTELADVASVDGARAGQYQHDVCPFGGIEDSADPAGWAALASVLHGHVTCVLVDPQLVPPGWEVIRAIPGVQMDGTALEAAEDSDAVTLTEADVPEMLALVERTRPGPYMSRTIEMGRYIGLRRDGELIAMAGERVHPEGWTEISAVCTDDR